VGWWGDSSHYCAGFEGMNYRFKIPEIVLGALVSSLLWVGILGWIDSYRPTEQQKRECYEAAQQGDQKTDECKTFWERTTSDPVAFFTLVLAGSTIGLWAATIALYIAGERQIKLTRDISNRQAIEIQNQIDIARQANRAAQKSADAAVATERARLFVVIENNFLNCINAAASFDGLAQFDETPLTINDMPMAGILFKNYGKTPAVIDEVGVGLVYSETTPDPVYDVRVVMENIVGPGDVTGKFGTMISGQMMISQAEKVRRGEGTLWIFGYVSYDDVFGERHIHRFFQRLVRVGDGSRFVLQAYDYRHYNFST
jgi:hypothetical protein